MALVKGICKNFGECDLADNKEVQEVDKTNFVCEECGKPLHSIDGGVTGTGDGKGPNKKLIGIIAATVVGIGAIGGGIYALWPFGGDDGTSGGENEKIVMSLNHTSKVLKVGESDTLVASLSPADAEVTFIWQASKKSTAVEVIDSIVTAKEVGESKVQVKAVIGTDTLKAICAYKVEKVDVPIDAVRPPRPVDPSVPVNPPYGKYVGDRNASGVPNGFGDVTFTKRKLVMGDIYAEPGYKIRNGRFLNGKLQSGTLYDADGNKVCFVDANNNL